MKTKSLVDTIAPYILEMNKTHLKLQIEIEKTKTEYERLAKGIDNENRIQNS